MTLWSTERAGLRNQLREARARAMADAEDFADVLLAIERVGSYVNERLREPVKNPQGLGDYLNALTAIAHQSSVPSPRGMQFGSLFQLVRQARNEAMHQGAAARHLASNAVSLALILEDGLVATGEKVSHFMVEGVTVAELWQTTAMVRHAMLEHSFSFLPLWDHGKWMLISDSALAKYLGRGSKGDRGKRQRVTVEEAISAPSEGTRLAVVAANVVSGDALVADVWPHLESGRPILVAAAKDESRLLGILTAFDLL